MQLNRLHQILFHPTPVAVHVGEVVPCCRAAVISSLLVQLRSLSVVALHANARVIGQPEVVLGGTLVAPGSTLDELESTVGIPWSSDPICEQDSQIGLGIPQILAS